MERIFSHAINSLFSGRPSSVPPPPRRNGNASCKNEDGNSSSSGRGPAAVGFSIHPAGVAAARRAGKREDGVHGIMTSALWAVARTPALVEAIERVEAAFSEDASSPLCLILNRLRRTDDFRAAAEAADAFLRTSRLAFHDHMEPMDAIRAIVGLCGDSEQVLEEAVSTTYRTTLTCTTEGCRFKRDVGLVKEHQLECMKSPKVQLCIEVRATSTRGEAFCDMCKKKGVVKRYVLEKPARCWVATWPALTQAETGQEMLCATDVASGGVQFRFKLGVMIANHRNKFVCVFRDGNDYYRVEGKEVKSTSRQDWLNVQPCLALFNLHGNPDVKSPRNRSPHGTGFSSSLPSTGGGQAGRKRQRQQMGYGQLSEGSGSTARGSMAAAEVIEVDDDDDSDRGSAYTSPTGGGGGGGGDADAGDRPSGDSSSSSSSNSSRVGAGASGEHGAAVTNGSEGQGKRKSRDGEREPEAKPPPGQAVDMDGSTDCEEVLISDTPASESDTAPDGGGHPSARARAAGTYSTAAAPAVAATPARRKRAARDAGRGAGSSPGATVTYFPRKDQEAPRERNRKDGLVGPPYIPSFFDGSPHGSSMARGGSPSEVGASNNRDRRPSLELGATSSSTPQRSRYFENPEGATRAPGHADLTAEANADSRMDVEGEDYDDDVQLVARKRQSLGRGEGGERGSPAASSPSSSGAGAGSGRSGVSGWIPRHRYSERGTRAGAVPDGSLASSTSTRLREREVHDVDDDAPPTSPTLAAVSSGKKHPSGAPMAFIGPHAPPPPPPPLSPSPQAKGDAGFIGPALPPQPKPDDFPPRPRPPVQQQAVSAGAPWLKRVTDEEVRRKAAAAARANRGTRKAGGGAAKVGAGGQATIPSSWEKTCAFSASGGGGGGGDGGGGGSSRGSGSGISAQTKPAGDGAAFLGGVGGSGHGYRLGGGGGSSSCNRQRSSEKVTEDLTGADDSCQDLEDVEGAGVGGEWSTSVAGGGGGVGGDATLTTIRGINLQRDHFDRILDSDGWLTSQIIDIRVKQLQELYPRHLYFDTSFFGFLCPRTERGGAFKVDYERVSGWTKASRLPAGKSSLFDMQKLFIPINQGNVHWVLVVVDMNDGGNNSNSSAKEVSFFDSFGRDGTTYVEAVQQYLVSELSHRDKTRQERFLPRTRPPLNAPRQHNSSDCGVLMLHVMEELSTGPAENLTRLTQEEIMSLRLKLVAKIRE
eukprot:g6271.t1